MFISRFCGNQRTLRILGSMITGVAFATGFSCQKGISTTVAVAPPDAAGQNHARSDAKCHVSANPSIGCAPFSTLDTLSADAPSHSRSASHTQSLPGSLVCVSRTVGPRLAPPPAVAPSAATTARPPAPGSPSHHPGLCSHAPALLALSFVRDSDDSAPRPDAAIRLAASEANSSRSTRATMCRYPSPVTSSITA